MRSRGATFPHLRPTNVKAFRTLIFWLHLLTGLSVGIVVLIMSVTGVLLTYEKQMTRWADTRALDGAPPAPEPAPEPRVDCVQTGT